MNDISMRPFLFNFAKAACVAATASILIFVLSYLALGFSFGYYWNYHPSDGQSGLGPFVTLLYSFVAAIVAGIAIFVGVFIKVSKGLRFFRRKESCE